MLEKSYYRVENANFAPDVVSTKKYLRVDPLRGPYPNIYPYIYTYNIVNGPTQPQPEAQVPILWDLKKIAFVGPARSLL